MTHDEWLAYEAARQKALDNDPEYQAHLAHKKAWMETADPCGCYRRIVSPGGLLMTPEGHAILSDGHLDDCPLRTLG